MEFVGSNEYYPQNFPNFFNDKVTIIRHPLYLHPAKVRGFASKYSCFFVINLYQGHKAYQLPSCVNTS